jgi:tetratricopeptide (TPR) repeat protein
MASREQNEHHASNAVQQGCSHEILLSTSGMRPYASKGLIVWVCDIVTSKGGLQIVRGFRVDYTIMKKPRKRAKANPAALPVRSFPQRSAYPAPNTRTLLLICIGLIGVNLFIYAGVWRLGFVNYDDPGYIQNSNVAAGLTWRGLSWAFRTGSTGNWHPLTWLSYMLDVHLYGLNPGPLHSTNLFFHIANTLLLFGVLYKMTGMAGRSTFVAGMFAAHPLHVESVAWISERKDVLSTLFWMLTLLAYLEYVRRPQLGRYILMFACLALGLMAKPMLVTLPFVLLLIDFWPLRRWHTGANVATLLRLIHEKIPMTALIAVSSVVTFLVQKEESAVTSLDVLPLDTRLQNMFLAYIDYIGQMLWPSRLAVFYPYYARIPTSWIIAALALTTMSILAVRVGGRWPFVPVGWFWYLGTLVPVIGVVQVGLQSKADRYTYVPLIGLFLVAAWGLPEISTVRLYRNAVLPAAGGLALMLCAVTARAQVHYWRSSQTLWEHALEVTSNNYIAHTMLGVLLREMKRPSEALFHYQEALRIKPNHARAYDNMGIALADLGEQDQAIKAYNQALRLRPDLAEGHQNLALALENLGRLDEAIAHLSEALRLNPEFANAHNALATIFFKQEKFDDAIAEYSQAVRIKPDFADAQNNLGAALIRRNRIEEAIAHLSLALRINPNLVNAHYNLGVIFSAQGRTGEAVREFSEVLRIDPSRSSASEMLAQLRTPGAIQRRQ